MERSTGCLVRLRWLGSCFCPGLLADDKRPAEKHADFLHLLFNMLWLYWFGRMAMEFFNRHQLAGIYISGGVAGALMYMLTYKLSWFQGTGSLNRFLEP